MACESRPSGARLMRRLEIEGVSGAASIPCRRGGRTTRRRRPGSSADASEQLRPTGSGPRTSRCCRTWEGYLFLPAIIDAWSRCGASFRSQDGALLGSWCPLLGPR
jgi:hypothetical protein